MGAISLLSIFYVYQPKVSGTIYLRNAYGVSTITTEDATGIAHIRGDNLNAAVYGQGYQHA